MDDPIASAQPELAVTSHLDDARRAVAYLVAPEARDYIAIMDVLESSITDLAPLEIGLRVRAAGGNLSEDVLDGRLDKLREWGAVSGRTDTSRIFRYTDLLARNWRYAATPIGRHVQRFYRKILAGEPAVREIPLSSLARVVEGLEALSVTEEVDTASVEAIGRIFVDHDDLDGALVGAEDSLATLSDRFDLNNESTAELKTLLVGYATHVAVELDRGSLRACEALERLQPRFSTLAAEAVRASEARALIERGALVASRGGRVEDWIGLLAWFDPTDGRSARFSMRLVRALPGMHVNIRRLHTSSGMATSRSRALALARACRDAQYGTAILLAALGDHSWRKLYGAADDLDLAGTRSWRQGPGVEVPELLRITGRAGARGRAAVARDDTAAREAVAAVRQRRTTQHAEAVREVLAASPGAVLSEEAARAALSSLCAAARAAASEGRRTAAREGLCCTLFDVASRTAVLRAPTWSVWVPGRVSVFHLPHVPVWNG